MANTRIKMTVREYFQKFINSKVDLNDEPKQCCPFHQEKTPSFSYNPSNGTWRCYGSCKTGGDVVDLHRMNYKLKNRTMAEESLHDVLGIPKQKITSMDDLTEQVFINEENAEIDRIYHLTLIHANNSDRWVQMDYAMSIYPIDVVRLKDLLTEWNVQYE